MWVGDEAITSGARIMGINKQGNHGSAFKPLKLQFRTNMPKKIFTGKIKGEGEAYLEVALIDVSTEKLVQVGPDASLWVEIVPLKGGPHALEGDDWTAEEFEANIVQDTKGKMSLLSGITSVKLQRGIGVMNDIKFIHRASERKPPEFCLGARVVDTLRRDRVKEGKTECFTVKNYRGLYFKKYEIPSLMDPVYRLKNIWKGGKIYRRLQDNQINTVEDFLIRFLRDPTGLQSIVQMVPKKWSDTLKNAQKCEDKRMYCYADFQQKAAIVFNIHGQVQRLHLNTMNMALEHDEATARDLLLSAAYEHWEDGVKYFDDENFLEEYLAGLTESRIPIDFPMQNFLSFNHLDVFSIDSLTTFGDMMHDEFIPESQQFNVGPADLWNFDGGPVNEPNFDQHMVDAAAAGLVDIQDVHKKHSRNRWNIFRYIWKYSTMCKKKMRKGTVA